MQKSNFCTSVDVVDTQSFAVGRLCGTFFQDKRTNKF